jgi:hypothetical protein
VCDRVCGAERSSDVTADQPERRDGASAVVRLADLAAGARLVRVPVELHDELAAVAVPQLLGDYVRLQLEDIVRVSVKPGRPWKSGGRRRDQSSGS